MQKSQSAMHKAQNTKYNSSNSIQLINKLLSKYMKSTSKLNEFINLLNTYWILMNF